MVCRCQRAQELGSSLPVGEDVQSAVSDRLPQGWPLFVSEPLPLPFCRDFQSGCQPGTAAGRQLQGCTYVSRTCGCCDSSAESSGNRGKERGWTPQCTLPASSLVCDQCGLCHRSVPVLEWQKRAPACAQWKWVTRSCLVFHLYLRVLILRCFWALRNPVCYPESIVPSQH